MRTLVLLYLCLLSIKISAKEDILIVIDMQKGFHTSSRNQTVVDNVLTLIEEHKKKQQRIYLIKSVESGSILPCIQKACKGAKVTTIEKAENSGASNFMRVIQDDRTINLESVENVYICGINTQHCVKDTVTGLRLHPHFPQNATIIVEGRACNGEDWTLGPFKDTQMETFEFLAAINGILVKDPHGAMDAFPGCALIMLGDFPENLVDDKDYPEESQRIKSLLAGNDLPPIVIEVTEYKPRFKHHYYKYDPSTKERTDVTDAVNKIPSRKVKSFVFTNERKTFTERECKIMTDAGLEVQLTTK